MSYRTVDERFWTDPGVLSLNAEEKLLFFYFITNPHSHYSGIYYLPAPIISYETGILKPEYPIDTLSKKRLVFIEKTMCHVWVKNMAKFNVSNEKQTIGVSRHLETLQDSSLLREFLKFYPKIPAPKNLKLDTVLIPYQYTIDTKETETETETETEKNKNTTRRSKKQNSVDEKNDGTFPKENETSEPSENGKEGIKEKTKNGWAIWVDVNRENKRVDPVPLGKDLKIIKGIWEALGKDPEKAQMVFGYFLQDPDKFLVGRGYNVSDLQQRLNKYLNPDYNATPEDDYYLSPSTLAEIDEFELKLAMEGKGGYPPPDQNPKLQEYLRKKAEEEKEKAA